jgi:hypothetical protein
MRARYWMLLLLAAGCSGNLDGARNGSAAPPAAPPVVYPPAPPPPGSAAPTPPPVVSPPAPAPTPAPMVPPPPAPAPPPAAPPPAQPPAPPPTCIVSIQPDNPPRLTGLLAGPASRLRVRARVSGPSAPASPSWKWEVMRDQSAPVATTAVDGADVVELPLAAPGAYYIRAEAAPGCETTVAATASAASDRILNFWVRVTPPRALDLPSQDINVFVGGRYQPVKTIALERGQTVRIDPHDRNNIAIGSYIRVTSPQSTVRFEGHNQDTSTGFTPALLPMLSYDVLVVPDGAVAPALIRGLRLTELVPSLFTLDAGFPVAGEVRSGGGTGTPVQGARVLLRQGRLPSTIGVGDANGRFELRARAGTWSAVVLPPADSTLPEAHIENGMVVVAPASLRFQWKALPSGRLDVVVVEPGGQPTIRRVRVRIESEAGQLPDVGTFQTNLGDAFVASGFLRREAYTEAGGIASFNSVPAGRYRVFAIPGAEAVDVALTAASVTMPGGQASPRITLARPVPVIGKLTPPAMTAGLRVVALDTEDNAPGESVTTTVDEAGQFTLLLAPGRNYRLQVEPAQERKVPRLFLGPVTANAATTLPEVAVTAGVTFVGSVTIEQSQVPGAVVQVYCTGLPPDCVDPTAPQTDAARPVGETVTGTDGRFQVHLPDPATWPL